MWWNTFIQSVWGEIFIQSLGFIGIFFMVISVQFNSHKKIMACKTLGALMFVLQYLFLKAFTGMILDIIGIFRNIVFTKNVQNNKSNKGAIIFFSVFTIVAGVLTITLTWQDLTSRLGIWNTSYVVTIILGIAVSIFSITAKTLTTIAYALSDLPLLRKLNFSSSALWLVYNITYLSLSGCINEILVMLSIVVAQIRFRKDKKNTN